MGLFVNYLTPRRRQRQRIDRLGSLLLAATLLPAAAVEPAAASTWQAPAEISAAAEDFLRNRAGTAAGRTTVRAGTLDPRHRLPQCGSELEGFLRRGTRVGPRTVVGVRCPGPKPWKVYLPVDVIVTASVLTARQSLPRGHLVTAADLAVAERDVSRMLSGYLSDPAQLAGQRLTQPLLAGQVVTPAMLAADRIIKRGQTVTLVAASGGVNISMSGKALSDGALHQRVRVENVNSGRVVEGIVRSAEHVEVIVSAEGGFFNARPKASATPADTQASNNDR